jgi:hypothetical protein
MILQSDVFQYIIAELLIIIYSEDYCLLECVICLMFTDVSPKREKSR